MNFNTLNSDLDGTMLPLLATEAQVPDVLRQTVQQANASGLLINMVTGRKSHSALAVGRSIGLTGPAIMDNGATIREVSSGKLLGAVWLAPEVVRPLVAAISPFGQSINYTDAWDPHPPQLGEASLISDTAPFVWADVPQPKLTAVMDRLAGFPGIAYHATDCRSAGQNFHVQITDAAATKSRAIARLADLLETRSGATAAIGDGDNDDDMLVAADHGIAMGNATPALLAVADCVTAPIEQGGWFRAVYEHFGIGSAAVNSGCFESPVLQSIG